MARLFITTCNEADINNSRVYVKTEYARKRDCRGGPSTYFKNEQPMLRYRWQNVERKREVSIKDWNFGPKALRARRTKARYNVRW